jgi:hypothetical protein
MISDSIRNHSSRIEHRSYQVEEMIDSTKHRLSKTDNQWFRVEEIFIKTCLILKNMLRRTQAIIETLQG